MRVWGLLKTFKSQLYLADEETRVPERLGGLLKDTKLVTVRGEIFFQSIVLFNFM